MCRRHPNWIMMVVLCVLLLGCVGHRVVFVLRVMTYLLRHGEGHVADLPLSRALGKLDKAVAVAPLCLLAVILAGSLLQIRRLLLPFPVECELPSVSHQYVLLNASPWGIDLSVWMGYNWLGENMAATPSMRLVVNSQEVGDDARTSQELMFPFIPLSE
jgi:hypothetical protein